jgi:hypothetical protein
MLFVVASCRESQQYSSKIGRSGADLCTKVAKFFDKRLNLRRRAPRVKVETAQHTLTGVRVCLDLQRWCFEVDRKRQVTDGACRLKHLLVLRKP